MNPFSLEGKTAVITGGCGFLGLYYAETLVKAGAKVMLWDNVSREKLFDAHEALRKKGCKADMWRVDITDEEAVYGAVREAHSTLGRIDILVNNAAMNPAVGSEESAQMFVPYDQYPIDLFRKEIEVNLVGTMICIKAVAPDMMDRHAGTIVNVASEVSNIAHDHRVYNAEGKFKSPAYVASKTAIVGLTRQWAAFLGPYGVRINAFSPGGVRNEKMPADFVERFGAANMLGRMAEPHEHANTLLFLCSDASSFLTGANITADGGKSAW